MSALRRTSVSARNVWEKGRCREKKFTIENVWFDQEGGVMFIKKVRVATVNKCGGCKKVAVKAPKREVWVLSGSMVNCDNVRGLVQIDEKIHQH